MKTEAVIPKRRTWTMTETATILGVSRRHLYDLCRSGSAEVPFVRRLGEKLFVSRAALAEYLGTDEAALEAMLTDT